MLPGLTGNPLPIGTAKLAKTLRQGTGAFVLAGYLPHSLPAGKDSFVYL